MRNRKGFTLIEMMAVIAIIAILVSVVIPIVGKSTLKARAATNAANLRAVEGSVTSKGLLETGSVAKNHYYTAASGTITDINVDAPVSEEVNADGQEYAVPEGIQMQVYVDDTGSASATYNGYDAEFFAYIAENGVAPEGYQMDAGDQLKNDVPIVIGEVNKLIDRVQDALGADSQYIDQLQGYLDTLDGYTDEALNSGAIDKEAASEFVSDVKEGMTIINGILDAISRPGC